MSEFELTTTTAQPAVAIREKVKVNEIPQAMGRMFGEVCKAVGEANLAGPPFAYYYSWSDQEVDMACGFPVAGTFNPSGNVKAFTLPAVKAVVAMHVGPYDKLMDTYTKMQQWMGEKKLAPADYMWEFYLNSPEEVPPEKLMSKLIWPVK